MMWKNVRRMKVPHKLIYAALAVLYLAASLGVDKSSVLLLISISYAVLAMA